MVRILLTRPSYLAAASLFAATDPSRYYLCGVCIERNPEGGIFLIATDGHRMAVFLDRDGKADADYIVPVSKQLFAATKSRPKGISLRLEVEGDVLRVFQGEDEIPEFMQYFAPIDGTFPDWRRVVPKVEKPKGSDGFNARILAEISKMLGVARWRQQTNPIRLRSDGDGPTLVTTEWDDWFGVIMPMRVQAYERPPFSLPQMKEAA